MIKGMIDTLEKANELRALLEAVGVDGPKKLSAILNIPTTTASTFWNHPEKIPVAGRGGKKGAYLRIVSLISKRANQMLMDAVTAEDFEEAKRIVGIQNRLSIFDRSLYGMAERTEENGWVPLHPYETMMGYFYLIAFSLSTLNLVGLKDVAEAVLKASRKGEVRGGFSKEDVFEISQALFLDGVLGPLDLLGDDRVDLQSEAMRLYRRIVFQRGDGMSSSN